MSFVGGGSDLPVFYRKFGGAVVSTAINQFVYITVNKKFDEKIRVSYSKTEEAGAVDRIKHPLVREAMKLLKIDGGMEITSVADIPGRGSGLGSSSSFTVGLLHALHAYAERYASAEQLAREACEIEIERCGEPIGKQDQYAAAFGGFGVVDHLLQLLAGDLLLAWVRLLVDESHLLYGVAGVEEEQAFAGQAVAPGAAGFLIVALDGLRQVVVDDEPDVRFVDAHAEGDGGAHHPHLVA